MYTLMNMHKHFSRKNRLFASESPVFQSHWLTSCYYGSFSSAAVLRGNGCAFGVRRPEASQAAHAASSTAKSRSAWHICCLLSLEMPCKLSQIKVTSQPYHWNRLE